MHQSRAVYIWSFIGEVLQRPAADKTPLEPQRWEDTGSDRVLPRVQQIPPHQPASRQKQRRARSLQQPWFL